MSVYTCKRFLDSLIYCIGKHFTRKHFAKDCIGAKIKFRQQSVLLNMHIIFTCAVADPGGTWIGWLATPLTSSLCKVVWE